VGKCGVALVVSSAVLEYKSEVDFEVVTSYHEMRRNENGIQWCE